VHRHSCGQSALHFVLPLTIKYKKKSSLHISSEAVRIAQNEIRREEARLRFLLSIVILETSHISLDDRFAALQIDLGWRCVTPAYRVTVIRLSFPLQFYE